MDDISLSKILYDFTIYTVVMNKTVKCTSFGNFNISRIWPAVALSSKLHSFFNGCLRGLQVTAYRKIENNGDAHFSWIPRKQGLLFLPEFDKDSLFRDW